MRILHLSFLSCLVGVMLALGGCILTIMGLSHQATFFGYGIPQGQIDPFLIRQYGYPIPWVSISMKLWGGGVPTLIPRIDYLGFAANFAIYTFSLLAVVWTVILLMTYLRRKGYLVTTNWEDLGGPIISPVYGLLQMGVLGETPNFTRQLLHNWLVGSFRMLLTSP